MKRKKQLMNEEAKQLQHKRKYKREKGVKIEINTTRANKRKVNKTGKEKKGGKKINQNIPYQCLRTRYCPIVKCLTECETRNPLYRH
jgi:hypothetical protein